MHLALLKVALILMVLRNLREGKVLKVDNVLRSCKPVWRCVEIAQSSSLQFELFAAMQTAAKYTIKAHAEVPVLHSRLSSHCLLQWQPMQVQELLQLLQLGGLAQFPRPAHSRRAGSETHTLLFTFQECFTWLLQARLVGWDICAGRLVQMHGPHMELQRETFSDQKMLGSSGASTLQKRAQCHHATTSTRWYDPGCAAQEDHRIMQ